MDLQPGAKLGPYEIVSLIGSGGMGEVWKAHDSRLKREVAIKTSRTGFSARFQHEAQAVAALNHSHICTLYDVGPDYLVMEYIEGPTLAERILQGPIPLEEALGIARQIGGALEAAHERHIVHRDLKPANIKIRPDGSVKVLDFGLAKKTDEAAAVTEDSPTRTAGTQPGTILGTVGYMSPEQARGQAVDKRADIWAFGVVLHEMLTGQRLFDGDSMPDTLVSVLTKEPEWNRVPAKAHRLLRSCLEKDPRQRLRDVGDAWRLLEEPPPAGPAKSGGPWKVAVAAAIVLAVVSTISLLALWRAPQPAGQPLVTLNLDLGPEVSLVSGYAPAMDLSPDGKRIAFVSEGPDGIRHLFTLRLDQPHATVLAKTDGALGPFFSPDGRWLGFFADQKLKKIPAEGGEPVVLCEAPDGRGASWGEDDGIIATLHTRAGLVRVPAAGGTPTVVTRLDLERGEASHRWPQVLPGGKAVLFTRSTVGSFYGGADIEAVSLSDRRTKMVLERAGMYARYLPSGHLTYVSNGTLYGVPFDLDRLATHGAPVPLLEGVSHSPLAGSAQLNFTPGGTLVYRSGVANYHVAIQWLDGAGQTEPLWAEPGFYQAPRLSPDGKLLAIAVAEGPDSHIWVYDWERRHSTRLTQGAGVFQNPVWHPDGQYVVFLGPGGMFWARADGVGKPRALTESKYAQNPYSFRPDGKRLAFSELNPGGGADIRILPVEAGPGQLRAGAPESFLRTPATAPSMAFSPDGRWLAYSSSESGALQVYVRAYPNQGSTQRISSRPAALPVWSPNGRELFYQALERRIMVVSYAVKGDSFEPGTPRPWSSQLLADVGNNRAFDLSPDGKRCAVLTPAPNPNLHETRSHVMLLVHFFDEVRRRVAGGSK
jgi:serine/threonine-protein kinase